MRVLLKKLSRRDAGFTLTELAVAMVVIGVLASIAVPNFLGARNDSYDHEAQSAVTAALNAADTHYANYGDFSPSTNATCHTSGNTNLVSDLQRLEPNFSFVVDNAVSDNPRVVSVDAANSYNSNGEDLGCQVFYATALSRSGTCFVGRLSVEGKYLAANKTYPIVVSSDGSDSNAATNELTGSAQNGRAYGAIKVDAAGAATSTGTETLAAAKNLCTANAQTGTSAAVLQRSYYDGWRTIINWSQDPGRRLSTFVTVDATGNTGQHTSVAIGTDGFPIISYQDGASGDLRVAHCDNAACTTSTKTTVDSAGYTGSFTSITIGDDGLPFISYNDGANRYLRVAHCDNAACTSSTLTTVDASGYTGSYTSVAIGTDHFPIISYQNEYGYELRVAHCDNAACTSSTLTTVDNNGWNGYHTSITIGADGLPIISYYNSSSGDLRVAHCINVACTGSSTLTTVDDTGSTGQYTSITVGSAPGDFPVISYLDSTHGYLRVAHCTNADCSTSTKTTVDASGSVWHYTSVKIGSDNLPVISYYNVTNHDLRVAHCTAADCASSTLVTVDATGDTGWYSSVAIGADGFPFIAYWDFTNNRLRAAHCVNVTCT